MKIKEYHGMNILIIHFSNYHFLGYEDDDDNNEIENYKKYVIIEEAYNKMEIIRNNLKNIIWKLEKFNYEIHVFYHFIL